MVIVGSTICNQWKNNYFGERYVLRNPINNCQHNFLIELSFQGKMRGEVSFEIIFPRKTGGEVSFEVSFRRKTRNEISFEIIVRRNTGGVK